MKQLYTKRLYIRALTALTFCAVLITTGCTLTADPMPEGPEPLKNPTGVSGKFDPRAEQNFGKAYVLWRSTLSCSNPALAEQYLREALTIEPFYTEASVYLALALSESALQSEETSEEAVDIMSTVIRRAPTAQHYAVRGLVFYRQSNLLGAQKDISKALALNKKNKDAWLVKGYVHIEKEEIKEACISFEQACNYGDCTALIAAQEAKACL